MGQVVAASSALRDAAAGTYVVTEGVNGPRFPNGVVIDALAGGAQWRHGIVVDGFTTGRRLLAGIADDGATNLALSPRRWWDPQCRVDRLSAERVRRFVAETKPLPLPGPPETCIGWGPGLTPAADDVVVGMLIGLHASGNPRAAHALAESCAGTETVPFSRALLDHAAQGRAVRPLLSLVEALAGLGDVDQSVAALHRFGATSGRHIIDGVRRALSRPPSAAAQGATEGAQPLTTAVEA